MEWKGGVRWGGKERSKYRMEGGEEEEKRREGKGREESR